MSEPPSPEPQPQLEPDFPFTLPTEPPKEEVYTQVNQCI